MKSHNNLRAIYGTSPMYISQTHMGPVPYVFLRYLWDQSHRWFSDSYGTSSWKSKHEVPCLAVRHLWDQSHRCLKSIYGTGPIGISQPAMGPHAKIFMMKSHTYLRTIYGTGPMDISEIRMGLVPYVSESYTWDWSHRWFSDSYGTSLWKYKHEVPCLAVSVKILKNHNHFEWFLFFFLFLFIFNVRNML